MGKNIFLLLTLLLLVSGSAFARRDSIGNKVIGNMLYVLHKVEKSEGLYAISRRYNVDVASISAANPGTENGLQLGQVIMVPCKAVMPSGQVTTAPVTTPSKEQPKTTEQKVPVYYTVKSGETLYRIAVNHQLTVAQLQEMNGMKDNNIEVGQQLIIGYKGEPVKQTATTAKTPEPVANTIQKTITTPSDKSKDVIDPQFQQQYNDHQKMLEEKRNAGKTEVKIVQEGGMATWIDDGSIVTEKNLALHKTAPPGTLIQLKNPMNGKVVYVKVIGKLPDNPQEEKVVIKITKTAADFLGVRDQYFRVEQYYSFETVK